MADDALALMIIYMCTKEKKMKKKRKWTKDWLLKRDSRSHVKLLKDVELTSPDVYKNFLRMDAKTYDELLFCVTPSIKKQNTMMRESISPNERLSATLRFLATGQTFEDLKFLTTISAQSLGRIIIETCKAICAALKPFINMPSNPAEWKEVAEDFENKWNFTHCIGAIDGKHVNIVKPAETGSYFYNYKKQFSIVLMAVVNANYEFMAVEVGANGRASDAGVFGRSKLKLKYDDGELNLPEPEKLPLSDDILPYVLVGDDAFPLLINLMKPYSRRQLNREETIFNYRLSRARRIVENAFGILANRFRILHTVINLCPEKATLITLTCCYLHNFLSKKNSAIYFRSSNDDEQNIQLVDMEPVNYGNTAIDAKNIRNLFSNYFNTVGAVPWQNNYV